MRPFVDVFHGVITRVNKSNRHDCCSPTCLYINKKGEIEFRALKHLFFRIPHFSPLLRVARYYGELPEWEAPLKIIRERIKEDNSLGDRLFDIEREIKKDMTWADIEAIF